jgi:hypothetical protein
MEKHSMNSFIIIKTIRIDKFALRGKFKHLKRYGVPFSGIRIFISKGGPVILKSENSLVGDRHAEHIRRKGFQ